MGDEMGQEKCLERSLQASLINVVRVYNIRIYI
jgi:hypothetical protein